MNRRLLALMTALAVPGFALACLWDYDTLAMERARFPSALELITGKFLRHSPEFYEWRVRDRLAKLEKDRDNPAYLDDLAVAYDKLGQDEKAIELMLRKEKAHPGNYEAAANLGTFYLHSGQMDKGIEQLEKAMAINPDAHFGREKYQLRLAKYLMSQKNAKPLETKDCDSAAIYEATFKALCAGDDPTVENHQAAIKGVLGMMKFGKYDSPILLQVLGDLLLVDKQGHAVVNGNEDAKQLAARAYLKASYEPTRTRSFDRDRARFALKLQVVHGLSEDADVEAKFSIVEPRFKDELAEATAWYEDLRQKEIAWIRDGKNPEMEFDKLYVNEPGISNARESSESVSPTHRIPEDFSFDTDMIRIVILLAAVFVAAGFLILRRRRLISAT
jgi:tetratricopeptide (TPR) repeat protein